MTFNLFFIETYRLKDVSIFQMFFRTNVIFGEQFKKKIKRMNHLLVGIFMFRVLMSRKLTVSFFLISPMLFQLKFQLFLESAYLKMTFYYLFSRKTYRLKDVYILSNVFQ